LLIISNLNKIQISRGFSMILIMLNGIILSIHNKLH
jgi:hypothetical protein